MASRADVELEALAARHQREMSLAYLAAKGRANEVAEPLPTGSAKAAMPPSVSSSTGTAAATRHQ